MKKPFTSVYPIRLCLLLIGLLVSLGSYAQIATYDEKATPVFDFPAEADAKLYTLSFDAKDSPATFVFKGDIGVISTDREDAFKVVVPTGFKIIKAELAGDNNVSATQSLTLAFADGNPGYDSFELPPYNNGTAYKNAELGAGTYIGKVLATGTNISTSSTNKATWSITIYMEKICLAPDTPQVTATKSSVNAGESTMLSIVSGNLNEATEWKWYSGGCGGTLIGTGTSITVSPTSPTIYYVRGEGGCVTPGSCTLQYIAINPPKGEPGQKSYDESTGFDYPKADQTITYELNGEGIYTFKGTISGGDNLDTYKVSLSDKYIITGVKYIVSNVKNISNGEAGFAFYSSKFPINKFSTDFSLAQSGPFPLKVPGTYTQYVSALGDGRGLNAKWSMEITVAKACTESDVATVSATKSTICTGDMTTLSIKSGNLNDATTWIWYSGSCGGTPVGTGTSINVSPTATTTYYVRGEGGCTTPGTCASQQIMVNPLPVVSITAGLADAYCKDAAAVTLAPTGSPMGGSFTIDNTAATQFNPANLAVGNRSVLYTYTDNNGCTNTATKSVRVKAVPPTPTLLTQNGQAYAGGKSNVDVDLNTVTVNLLVGNCTGTINWSGSDNTTGTTSTIMVPSTKPGTFVYQATCTSDGCVSQPVSATVKVSAYLTVYHRDVDNNPTNNNIKPQLQLTNQGGGALPLSAITLRYYLTVENGGTLNNSFIDYAQVGSQNVKLQYVAQEKPGMQSYVEYSFTAGAGSLGTGANSGVINSYFAKSDYGSLNELDDYSYAPQRDQVLVNPRITAYYNGILIAGVEPGVVSTQKVLRALTESKNGASATQIGTYLVINNEGTTPISYKDLRARYYFTAEGSSSLRVELDYAQVGDRNVQLTTGRLSPAATNADSYVDVRFTQDGQLMPGASTGQIRYRVYKSDYSRFDQTNDYSYQEQPQESSSNRRVVLYVGDEKVWGTEPAALSNADKRMAASVASVEPGTELTVRVLGNPITDGQMQVEVTGAQNQSLRLSVSDLTGRVVTERHLERAGTVEKQTLNVSSSGAGLFLLHVSTPTQSQTTKVLKVN